MIVQAWAADGVLVDPPFAVEGHAGIPGGDERFARAIPGHQFRQASAVDSHHNQFRYAWEFVTPDGAVALAGIDIGEVAHDGRLQRITGFWGDLEAAE